MKVDLAHARHLGVSREALELYAASDVIDLHLDSFIWTRSAGYDLTKRHGRGLFGGRFYSQVDIPRALEGGLSGGTWVITTNPFRRRARRREVFTQNLARLRDILAGAEGVALVSNAAEYRAARAEGKHGAFIGVQGGNALDDDLDALTGLGESVLRITLVHLSTSSLGATSSPLQLGSDPGLTDFGRDYVRKLDDERIFVDLAHISRRGFVDALEVHDPSLPVLVTHTGVCGVHDHWRNLTDAQIRAVADTGGTIGVMYQSSFLGDSALGGRARAVVEHLAHIVEVAGEDYASLGSDWDGMITPPRDLVSPEDLPKLVHLMLERRWSPERIQKILGGNFLRVVGEMRG